MQAFLDRGEDFVVADTLPELVAGMNRITGGTPELDLATIEREIVARDREIDHPFTKDLQITAIRGARHYLGDKLIRVAPPHRLLDPEAGPLIAVRLNLLTRKTLGGLETDLSGRVLRPAARSSRGCTRPARSPASAAAACTATGRWRAPSSAAACSRGGAAGRAVAAAL